MLKNLFLSLIICSGFTNNYAAEAGPLDTGDGIPSPESGAQSTSTHEVVVVANHDITSERRHPISTASEPNLLAAENTLQSPEHSTGRSFEHQRSAPTIMTAAPREQPAPTTAVQNHAIAGLVASQSNNKDGDLFIPANSVVMGFKRSVLCLAQVMQPLSSILARAGLVAGSVGLLVNSFGIVDEDANPVFTQMILYGFAGQFLFNNLGNVFEKKIVVEEEHIIKNQRLKRLLQTDPFASVVDPELQEAPASYKTPLILPNRFIRGYYSFLLSSAQIFETVGDLAAPILGYIAVTSYLSVNEETQAIEFITDPAENPYAKEAVILIAASLVTNRMANASALFINKWGRYLRDCHYLKRRIEHETGGAVPMILAAAPDVALEAETDDDAVSL